MTMWQDRPPAPTEFAGIRLVRIPPNKTWHGVITCDRLIGCYTHFAHRHTEPCTGNDCALCLSGQPSRWHGYVSYWNPTSHSHVVLELTALAATPVVDYFDRQGTLRGADLEVSRIGNRPNSPVNCKLKPADIDKRSIPKSVDLKRFLQTLWNMQENATPEESRSPASPFAVDFEEHSGNGASATPPSHTVSVPPEKSNIRPNIRNSNHGNHPENSANEADSTLNPESAP